MLFKYKRFSILADKVYIILSIRDQDMFISQNQQKVTLKQYSPQMLALSTAYKGFVFAQVSRNPSNIQKLVHIDENGNRLKEFDYVDSLDTFGMFNEREVIVMNVNKNTIDVIDLSNYSIRSYPHEYAFQDTAYMDLHVFHSTKIFCIQEKGSTGDHRLILSYYSYDIKEVTLLERFQSTDQFNCEFYISKLNNTSKIGWWKNTQNDLLQFYVYQVGQNEGKPILVSTINSGQGVKEKIKNLNITNMWETTENNYLLVCQVTKGKEKQGEQKNANLIYNASTNIVREAKFIFPGDWNYWIVDSYYLGEMSIFYTMKFQNGQALQSPVYYVNNEREEIIAQTTWKCSSASQFYIPGFDSSLIIETNRPNGKVQSLLVNTIKLVTLKEMYLYFLLHIQQDFDDDLLSDATDLLQ